MSNTNREQTSRKYLDGSYIQNKMNGVTSGKHKIQEQN
jgi:hypothetical protein